jgi:hypothetical protein
MALRRVQVIDPKARLQSLGNFLPRVLTALKTTPYSSASSLTEQPPSQPLFNKTDNR